MLKKILEKIAYVQERFPILIIILMLTITAFFAYYSVRLETDSSFDVMFTEDSDTIRLQRLLSDTFGSTDTMFVLVSIDENSNEQNGIKDIRDPQVLLAMKQLTSSLEAETPVDSVVSLGYILEQVYGRLPEDLEESKLMIANLPEDIKQDYLSSFLSDDYSAQNLLVSVDVPKKPGSVQKIEDMMRDKIAESPFPLGTKAELTGMPILMNRIMLFLINDNVNTIGLALIGVFLILWFYFRSWKIAFLSVTPVMITLAWLSGTMYLLGIRLTIMIASVGAMLVGLSIDYAIHLTHAFHERVKQGDKMPNRHAVVGVGSALTASALTTVAGFLALTLGVTPNSQTQGAVLSIGVTYAFLITIVLLPAAMVLQRKFIYSPLDNVLFKIRGKAESVRKNNFLYSFLKGVGKIQVRSPVFVLLGVLGITFLIIPGFGLVYLDTDDEGWLPEDDDVVDSLTELGTKFGGTDSMNLLFRIDKMPAEEGAITDLRDPRLMVPMSRLDRILEDIDWIDVVESPSNDIRQAFGSIPQDFETIKGLYENNPELKSKFSDDFSIARMTIRFDNMDLDDYYEVMSEVDTAELPGDVMITPQGSIPENIELEKMLGSDTARTTLLGFLFVILIASFFYRSFLKGMMAFIPIIFAVVWTVGMMGYINLPFTVLTTGMLAILMGMGIDFAIHLMHAITDNIEKGVDLQDAVPEALMSTGEAIAITTMTTIFGFMVLSFATLINTQRLGWTLALGILMTFFSCILIVPSVMVLKYRRGAENA